MINLLKVELKTMFKKFTILVIFVCVFLGILSGILNKSQNYGSCEGIIENAMFLLIFLSSCAGFYISKDYTQNTIRNKVIVGHTRLNIYLSKLITVILFLLICMCFYTISTIMSNVLLIGAPGFSNSILITGLIVLSFSTISIAALITFISMSIKSEHGGLMPLLVMFFMLIFCVFVEELLYLSNSSDTLKIIFEILPFGQFMKIGMVGLEPSLGPINSLGLILYSVGLSFFVTLIGYLIFKKSDLK